MGGIESAREAKAQKASLGMKQRNSLGSREWLSISVDVSNFLRTNKVGGDYVCVLSLKSCH